MFGDELRAQILPDRLILLDLRCFVVDPTRAFLKIGSDLGNDLTDAMLDQPTSSFVAAEVIELLHELDDTAALTGGVAVPAAIVDVERGSAFLGVEGALAPPVIVPSFLRILRDLECFEQSTPV